MFSLHGNASRLCDGVSRREWLRVGALGSFGLTLPELLASKSASVSAAGPELLSPNLSSSFGKAKNCIVLFMLGGPPQHETWDPKPHAPSEVRGEFQPISTATPGLQVGELMPNG